MLDYLVIGLGLAGIAFCERLEEEGKAFHVVSDQSQTSSSVAGGLYNPVILKRFTLTWKASEQLALATPFYSRLEKKLGVKLDHELSIVRRFHSEEEQNLWFEATDKPFLADFLSPKILANLNPNVDAPYGFGKVLGTGRIETAQLLSTYAEYLVTKNLLLKDKFNYKELKFENGMVSYRSMKAERIVFAEGFGMQQNPFFNYLPMKGNKGEYVIIEAPELKEEKAIKSAIFCIPLGKNKYKVGANYDRNDNSNSPTENTKKELIQKMERFITCSYQIVGHVAGVRPTVIDRKPLVGQHPEHKELYLLNGFGSRGVLIAPYASSALLNFIESGQELNREIDIERFREKYYKRKS